MPKAGNRDTFWAWIGSRNARAREDGVGDLHRFMHVNRVICDRARVTRGHILEYLEAEREQAACNGTITYSLVQLRCDFHRAWREWIMHRSGQDPTPAYLDEIPKETET